jgi:intergrase/recombinase
MDKSFIDWQQFSEWVNARYSNTYARIILQYTKKYCDLINDVKSLELIKPTIKNNVVKSLIILSKFLGIHEQFKNALKNYGVKLHKQNALQSFLRILNNNHDVLDWYNIAISNLRDNEKTLLKLCLYSGLRRTEALTSFNKIIELKKQNRLNEYYDFNLNCLMHFKYPKEFIRRTKNTYISFIPESLVNEISTSEPVSYAAIRKRLNKNNIKVRIDELRDYFGTFLLQHGILEQEVNLLQGRIPPSIFVKHYWSPKLSELKDRVFKALNQLNQ